MSGTQSLSLVRIHIPQTLKKVKLRRGDLMPPKLTLSQVIEPILLFVKTAEGKPEDDPSDRRQDGDGRIVPYKQRIGGQRYSKRKWLDTSCPISHS